MSSDDRPAVSAAADESDLTAKQRRILEYLVERVEENTYFKSRLIGRDLGLSAKEVGSNMEAIADGDFGVRVGKWGYSSNTTWEVAA